MPRNMRDPDPECLARAVGRLPIAEREVLLLCARERLSPAAAAIRLGISPAAARRRLARALCALDRAAEKDGRERRRAWWKLL